MIAHYHYTEYVERFEEIYNMLSKEAVLDGTFEHQFGNIQGALRREPFDQYFLDQIRIWRNMLGRWQSPFHSVQASADSEWRA